VTTKKLSGEVIRFWKKMELAVLSKLALKDCVCLLHCFSFHLLVQLFTLPAVLDLVNKDLQYGQSWLVTSGLWCMLCWE